MKDCGLDSQGFTASININVNIHTNHHSPASVV